MIEAFITNAGKYAEGEPVAEQWADTPLDPDEVASVFAPRIASRLNSCR